MKLSIVVPAYNEEGAIASVVENVRAARAAILEGTGVREVEILVVDDGSRDRTAEIVTDYPDVRLVRHPRNRGYGAALMTGFQEARGEFLGFLDGDGTCDANDFVPLCRKLEEADLVLGTRLSSASRMPAIRRLGNRIFATLTRILSGKAVTDIATGMRVFRREVLDRLPSLPTGLHFTPAMTCHALFLTDLRVAEHEISYADRVGQSKLSVLRDGFRFLKIILDSSLVYLPLKLLGAIGFAVLALAGIYSIGPIRHYLRVRALPEDMIYRLLAIGAFATVGLLFLLVGLVAQKVVFLIRGAPPRSRLLRAVHHPRFQHSLIVVGILFGLGGIALNGPNLVHYARFGNIASHWSYVFVGGFSVVCGSLLFAMGILSRMIDLLEGPRRRGGDRSGPASE